MPGPQRILVVDDRANMRELLQEALTEHGYDVTTASSGEEAIQLIGEQPFEVVLTDLSMPGKGGIEVLRAAKSASPDTEVIIVTAYGTISSAVEAMRLGAYDFITKPFKISDLERKLQKIFHKLRAVRHQGVQTWIHPAIQHLVGGSAETKLLVQMIGRVAPSKSTVLITGPSGVGKELVARAIHEASPRRERPFVAVNCAALASGVLESELFGHEKGAFTGANERRIGRFERAHTGTLFLDEISEIDPGTQTKLLRVLQEGEIERVGGAKPIPVDVRIVAASNRDLQDAIAQGQFRQDFYYRLNVISLKVAPLRERRDDVPPLIDHFLRKYSLEVGKEVNEVDDEVLEIFLDYPWPGNVRELENVIERAVVLAEGSKISRAELPPELLQFRQFPQAPKPAQETLVERTDQLELEMIRGALERFHWNKTKAADHLGIKRTTLQYKIRKYGLE